MNMQKEKLIGHGAAVVTIVIWGLTFISTKILLTELQPVEILLFRFVMGYLALTAVCPHRMKNTTKKQELTFMAAGLTGVCMYYLLENIALTYTLAANVGVIIAVAPCFTAIVMRLVFKNRERINVNFFVGFLIAIVGICMISFRGAGMQVNPFGDFLAVSAAFVWAFYAGFTKIIGEYGYGTVQYTRKIFGYGILFMIPMAFLFGFRLDFHWLMNPVCVFNMMFLGFGASAFCFVSWNYAVKTIGATKTSVYIYLDPVITVVTSSLILREEITAMAAVGTLLTMAGLVVSEWKWKKQGANA